MVRRRPAPPPLVDASGLHVESVTQVDDRLTDVRVSTAALPAPVGIRVLLPDGYDPDAGTRYPVLYLLNGAGGSYRDWTTAGDAAAITAGLPLIVVEPEGGRGGWYTDWWNNGAGGPPMWETFHIDQVIPWVDANFSTVASRDGRAIGGLSMGGWGVMSYASRHPDLFVAAAAFSGAVTVTGANAATAQAVVSATAAYDGGGPGSVMGTWTDHQLQWRAHSSWDLASNLRDTLLYLSTGNGQPGGPFDGGATHVDAVEVIARAANLLFVQRLEELGIDRTFDDYGPGHHTWAYWRRGLAEALPAIMDRFADPVPVADPFAYTAAEPAYDIYGWDVAVARTAGELSTLRAGSGDTFRVDGSGTATITTPARYAPGAAYVARIDADTGTSEQAVTVDGDGRLTIDVPLGPPNPYEQFSPAAAEAGVETVVHTSTVTLTAVGAGLDLNLHDHHHDPERDVGVDPDERRGRDPGPRRRAGGGGRRQPRVRGVAGRSASGRGATVTTVPPRLGDEQRGEGHHRDDQGPAPVVGQPGAERGPADGAGEDRGQDRERRHRGPPLVGATFMGGHGLLGHPRHAPVWYAVESATPAWPRMTRSGSPSPAR